MMATRVRSLVAKLLDRWKQIDSKEFDDSLVIPSSFFISTVENEPEPFGGFNISVGLFFVTTS
jgi:hypothetical protein